MSVQGVVRAVFWIGVTIVVYALWIMLMVRLCGRFATTAMVAVALNSYPRVT